MTQQDAQPFKVTETIELCSWFGREPGGEPDEVTVLVDGEVVELRKRTLPDGTVVLREDATTWPSPEEE